MAQETFGSFAPALTAFEALTFAANKGVYATGADTFDTYDLTAGGRALGGVTGTANTFPYFSALNIPASASITAQALALLDDGSASTMRVTLGVDASRVDPTLQFVIADDFLFASTESGEIGELGWGFTNGTFGLVNADTNHPGICRRTSTAVSGTVASAFPGGGGTAPNIQMGQVDRLIWVIKPTTADADYDLRFGLASDFTADPPTNGVYFEKLAADTNWFAVTRISGVETRTDTGVAFGASWTTLAVRRVADQSVAFSVNGGSETTVSTNVPLDANALLFGFQIIPRSANARSVDVDYFGLRLSAMTR